MLNKKTKVVFKLTRTEMQKSKISIELENLWNKIGNFGDTKFTQMKSDSCHLVEHRLKFRKQVEMMRMNTETLIYNA